MAEAVHIPWYANGFRADRFGAALAEIAPLALRYGATAYSVYQADQDHYKFLQTADFAEHDDWDRYWHGPEFTRFRTVTSGWYQVPVLYTWHEIVAEGAMGEVVEEGAPAPDAT